MQFGVDLDERGETIKDVVAHRALGVVNAAVDNGAGDDFMIRVGAINALRIVESGWRSNCRSLR